MTIGHGKEWTKNRMLELRENRGNKCIDCDNNNIKELEFHHIAPTGLMGHSRGSYQRVKDISDHPDCYVLVCNSCHLKRHKKETNEIYNK